MFWTPFDLLLLISHLAQVLFELLRAWLIKCVNSTCYTTPPLYIYFLWEYKLIDPSSQTIQFSSTLLHNKLILNSNATPRPIFSRLIISTALSNAINRIAFICWFWIENRRIRQNTIVDRKYKCQVGFIVLYETFYYLRRGPMTRNAVYDRVLNVTHIWDMEKGSYDLPGNHLNSNNWKVTLLSLYL